MGQRTKYPPVYVTLQGGRWTGMKLRFYETAPPPAVLTYGGTSYVLTETPKGLVYRETQDAAD